MRQIRKRIYGLQNTDSIVGKAALHGLLSAYQYVDRIFLKRSQKLDRRSEKIVSKDRKLLCVIVPKCGSRTLIAGLEKAGSKANFDVSIHEKDIVHFQSGHDESFRFSFVRNPWARVYSCYVQKIRNTSAIKQALHYNGRPGLHAEMTFQDFVDWLCGPHGGDDVADRHWASQYLILGLDININYDFIGKVETMNEDLATICEQINLPLDTFDERRNTTGAQSDAYLGHYDNRMIEQVAQRYAKDIEYFEFQRPVV